MEARAEARYIRTSPQKARLVVDLIRGQRAGQAITILRSVNKRMAPIVEKVLRSAIANAENRSTDVDVDKLMVTEAYVNEGPRMKRIRPAPMGRAFRYQRRLTHIVVTVAEKKPATQVTVVAPEPEAITKTPAKPVAKKSAAKKAPAKKTAAKKAATKKATK